MRVANLPSGIDSECDDIRLVLRRWQVIVVDGSLLPYKALLLGSVDLFADEIVLLCLQGGLLEPVRWARFSALAELLEPASTLSTLASPCLSRCIVAGVMGQPRVAAIPKG